MNRNNNNSLQEEFKVIWKFFYNNMFVYVLLYVQNVLINRYMPSESLGAFSYGQSMLTLFASVYSMEVYSAYLRYIGISNQKELTRLVKKILCIASMLFIITALIYFKSLHYVMFFAFMWMRERLYFFRAKMDIEIYGRIKVFQYVCSITILFFLIRFNILNERTMIGALGVSYLAVSVIYSFIGKAKEYKNEKDDYPVVCVDEIIKYALPLSFNAIVVWLLGAADQMFIDKYLDVMTLTFYSVAFRIINIIRVGTGVIMEYWPRFYFEKMEKREFRVVKKMYRIFMVIVATLCIGSTMLNKQLYWIMGAKQYMSVSWMFCFLATAEMFRQWGAITMTFQSFMKNTLINVVCLSVLGGVKIFINWLTIENLGVSVLFYSTLFCYFIYFICSLYFGYYCEKKYIKTNKNLRDV